MLDSEEWRMYFMHEEDVRNELLRLHQFRRVHFESAGSIVQLSMELESPLEFAEDLVA